MDSVFQQLQHVQQRFVAIVGVIYMGQAARAHARTHTHTHTLVYRLVTCAVRHVYTGVGFNVVLFCMAFTDRYDF